jgi:cleavage stimulation factor subunit 2
VTDEEVVEILNRVGHVVSYRALTDKDTGKPRGYAFAEYSDADAAASAVRNLNNFELRQRVLRVDYANEKNEKEEGGHMLPSLSSLPPMSSTPAVSNLPPLPTGRDLDGSPTAEDAISKTLNAIPAPQLLGILKQMQELVVSDPTRAQSLLEQAPQLSYAIFQALLLLQLVDSATLGSIIQQKAAPPPAVQQYNPPPVPPTQTPYGQPGFPPQYPPQGFSQNPTPVAQPQYGAQPQPPQPPAAAVPGRDALIQQLLSMSQQQIDALPPAERAQIMALRQQFTAQFQR